MKNKRAVSITLAVLFFWSAKTEGQIPTGVRVKPSYPAGPVSLRTETEKLEFTYSESDFTPPYRLEYKPKTEQSFSTPELTMRARASAMTDLDYVAWLDTWDADARRQFEAQAHLSDYIAEQEKQWHAFLSVGQMVLIRHVETRDFVILTYRILDKQGRDIGGLELPSVFHRVGTAWLGTQQLSSDFLLLESPWITGKDSAERVIK